LARDLETTIHSEEEEARQLEKKMQVIRQVLYENMKDPERMRHLSSKFYVRLTKILEEMESQMQKYNAHRHEFIIFLQILLSKLRKEKLVATRHLDRRVEFGRHKGESETKKVG
ncbi:MAG: hypothetical protein QXH30_00505, partial [Candidatus Bilamarchaeaceae archaeon]